jgi:hypothetical protein
MATTFPSQNNFKINTLSGGGRPDRFRDQAETTTFKSPIN